MCPRYSPHAIALLLSISMGACRTRPNAMSQHSDCSHVEADVPQIDARVDTTAYAVTVRKGCALASWLTAFDSARGSFPDSLADLLRADATRHVNFPATEWRMDGWGRPFAYQRSGRGVTLHSAGPDGRDGDGDDVEFPVRASKGP